MILFRFSKAHQRRNTSLQDRSHRRRSRRDRTSVLKNSLYQEVPDKPEFRGAFHRMEIEISTDRNKSTSSRLLVFSNGKRGAIRRYLWLKLLWDQLTKEEFLLFLSLPETLKDPKIQGFLQCILIRSKKETRKRLLELEQILGEKISSRECYRGYQRMHLNIYQIERSLPSVAKYSGYVKSPSTVGSKHNQKVRLPEPTPDTEFKIENQMNWFQLLSVDEIPFFEGYSIPKMI